jgi:hypothetical protein
MGGKLYVRMHMRNDVTISYTSNLQKKNTVQKKRVILQQQQQQ